MANIIALSSVALIFCALFYDDAAAVKGDATYYDVEAGYTACGTRENKNDMVAAIGFPYWKSANPNKDPMCQKKAWVKAGGKQITVSIKDKCGSCGNNNIDLSEAAFKKFNPLTVGRFKVEWGFL